MRRRRVLEVFSVAVAALMTNGLYAHPGHDHLHWTSPVIHMVLYMSLITMVAIGIWECYQNRKIPSDEDRKDSCSIPPPHH